MSERSRLYLGVALVFTLLAACGADGSTTKDTSAAEDDSASDDDGSGDDDTASTGDDDQTPSAPPKGSTAKDAGGSGKIDAAIMATSDGGASSDAGASGSKPDAAHSQVDAGGPTRDGGAVPARDAGSSAPAVTGGKCCKNGDCLCHGDPPDQLSAWPGPYMVASYDIPAGTVYYPTDAEPPLAGVSICPGFLNVGPEMTTWGTFYASWGIVTVVTSTSPIDLPQIRGGLLSDAIAQLKQENNTAGSPLKGKMSGRYGTSGYSMGGGGTTYAAQADPTLKTSIGLAPWGGTGLGVTVPTLLMCGSVDVVADCGLMTYSVYGEMPPDTPKMTIEFPSSDHLASWFGPGDSGSGLSGGKALAFQKVFLEGDERWKQLLLVPPALETQQTNIQ